MNRWQQTCMAGVLAGCLAVSGMAFSAAASDVETYTEEAVETASETPAAAEISDELYEGTYNLLLIGSDRRSDSWNGNSDTMILVTLNENTKKIYMVSFMRDTAAAIPGVGTQKLNAAYANGGAKLLSETLVSNFGVHIDNYAAVDFVGVANIIDALGGVDIEQTPDEVSVTNDYIHSLCEDWGLSADEYYISEGTTHLNGLQALAYMRDRRIGNDYARTERQRTVLTALLASADLTDVGSAFKLLTTIMTDVDTDLGVTDMLDLSGYLSVMGEYDLITDRIPYDDLHSSSNEMLVPTQPDTNDRLLGEIYAKE